MTEPRDLDELDRLLAWARLPWTPDDAYIVAPVPTGRPNGEVIGSFLPGTGQRHVSYQQQRDNARLAAAAVNALPALIARVRAAEGVRVLAVGFAEIAEARIAALEAAARAVTARGGHGDGCLIRDYGGCTCGWEQALADLAALLEEGA